MVDNPFTAFIDLVVYDASIRALKKNREQADQSIQSLDLEYKNIEQERIKAKEHVLALHREVDMLERELREFDEVLPVKRQRLALANTPKEYFSLQQEIEAHENIKRERDNELLALWDSFEQERQQYGESEKKIIARKLELEKMVKELRQRLVMLDREIALKAQKRIEKEELVPAEWIERYQAMLKRTENPVVPVESDSCSACFYPISSNDLTALKRHKLLDCKGCYRILYYL